MEIRDDITTKNITDDEIEWLSTTQLYNILIGPAIIARNDFMKLNHEEKNNIPVVMLGSNCIGTLAPKVAEFVDQLQDEDYRPRLVVLSGGTAAMYKGEQGKKNLDAFIVKRDEWNDECQGKEEYGVNSLSDYFAPVEIQNISESDVLEYFMSEFATPFITKEQKEQLHVVREPQSSNTNENMVYSKEKIDEQDLPEIKKDVCVLVTRWTHLTRAILTALNQKETDNKFTKVYGMPCMDKFIPMCNFKNSEEDAEFREEAKGEIKRMRKYEDVKEMKLADLLRMETIIPGGPVMSDKEYEER